MMQTLPLQKLVIKQKGGKPIHLSTVITSDNLPYLGIEAIEKGEINYFADWYTTVHSTEKDIFVVADGARNGLILKGKKGAVGSTLFCLTPLWIDSEYLFYFLKLNEIQRKDTRHIESEFWNIEVPIIPLEQQRRVTNDIREALTVFEKQFKDADLKLIKSLKSLVNITSETLNKIQNLDDFKKAVLELAIKGDLTKEWRKGNMTFPIQRFIAENICKVIVGGNTPKIFSNDPTDIPFFKVYNLRNNAVEFFHKPQYVSHEIHNSILKRSKVFPNDILFNIVGPPLGKVALVPDDFMEANVNQAIAVFRVDTSKLIPEFLYYLLLEGQPLRNILPEIKGNAGQLNVSINQCRNFKLDVPSVIEQHKIVDSINSIFKLADTLNEGYDTEKLQLSELQKSVLFNFFENLHFEESIAPIIIEIELARDEKNIEIINLRKKQKQLRDTISNLPNMEIIDVLKSIGKPLAVNELWGKSKYSGNIDAFYEKLKEEHEKGSISWKLEEENNEIPQSIISLKQELL